MYSLLLSCALIRPHSLTYAQFAQRLNQQRERDEEEFERLAQEKGLLGALGQLPAAL